MAKRNSRRNRDAVVVVVVVAAVDHGLIKPIEVTNVAAAKKAAAAVAASRQNTNENEKTVGQYTGPPNSVFHISPGSHNWILQPLTIRLPTNPMHFKERWTKVNTKEKIETNYFLGFSKAHSPSLCGHFFAGKPKRLHVRWS